MSSSKRAGRVAGAFGLLAVLANPAAVVASRRLEGVSLLRALYVSVPLAVLFAFLGLAAARRARFARARSVYADAGGKGRLARVLVWAGVYAAAIGVVALGVYGALRSAG
jgi:hypothetical protein